MQSRSSPWFRLNVFLDLGSAILISICRHRLSLAAEKTCTAREWQGQLLLLGRNQTASQALSLRHVLGVKQRRFCAVKKREKFLINLIILYEVSRD